VPESQTIQLSAVFSTGEVARDAAVALTFIPASTRAGSVCYALDPSVVATANANPNIVAIITTPALADRVQLEKGCVIHPQPQGAFYQIHNRLVAEGLLRPHGLSEIHPTARVAPSAVIGRNVVLGPRVVIDHGAVVDDFSIVGEETYIGPHATIGGRGVYNTYLDGRNFMVRCAGAVRIGDRCEILSGAVIAKSYLCEFTELADDVKIGSRASVGHGCRIGAATIIGANSVIAGNVTVGRQVWTGPNVAIADGLKMGDQARALIGSVVIHDVSAGESVSGNFALSHAVHLRNFVRQRHAS